jgi:3-phenylpropionate/cinnamic acid dioxygenase small subunit
MTDQPIGLSKTLALYDSLVADVAFLDAASLMTDGALAAEVAPTLIGEARLLDRRQFDTWFDLWAEDAVFWMPLHQNHHPARDQGLILDDHRRLRERVWRMHDTSAWALVPYAQTVRMVGGVEAWALQDSSTDVIATSAISITHERTGTVSVLAGRQIHRLRRADDGWMIVRKILLCPAITAGMSHLGWIL